MQDTDPPNDWIARTMHCLADGARRRVVAEMRRVDRGERLAQDALARRIDGTTPAELYHVHLPALHESGLVEWDDDDGRVAPGPRLPDAAPLLDALERVDPAGSV